MVFYRRSNARSWTNIAPTNKQPGAEKCPFDNEVFFYFLRGGSFFFLHFRRSLNLPRSIENKFNFSPPDNNMTKQIFSTTDVAAEAACLRARVIGYRVTNVYDAGASKVRMMRISISFRSLASFVVVAVVVVVLPSPPPSRRRCRCC